MPPLCRARRHGPDCPQLEACRASRNPQLAAIVTIALETGLRRSELLGLTWDRVDLSRWCDSAGGNKVRQAARSPDAAGGPRCSRCSGPTGRVWRQRRIRTAVDDAGRSLQVLKELLSHADIKTALIYARPPEPSSSAE